MGLNAMDKVLTTGTKKWVGRTEGRYRRGRRGQPKMRDKIMGTDVNEGLGDKVMIVRKGKGAD